MAAHVACRKSSAWLWKPYKVDAAAWATLRADPAAKRMCDLCVRLHLLLGL